MPSHTRQVVIAMSRRWSDEMTSGQRLKHLASYCADDEIRTRLTEIAQTYIERASRLLVRMSASLGQLPPLMLPPTEFTPCVDPLKHFTDEVIAAEPAILHYADLAERLRIESDLSAAWICHLNGSELCDVKDELERIRVHDNFRFHSNNGAAH